MVGQYKIEKRTDKQAADQWNLLFAQACSPGAIIVDKQEGMCDQEQ